MRGTDHLLAAAEATGVPHVVAQSVASWTGIREGGWMTEEDLQPPQEVGPKPRGGIEALRHVEDVVVKAGGAVLCYGGFYGPGATDDGPSVRRGWMGRRRDCGHLHQRTGDTESRHHRRTDERRDLRGAKRGCRGSVRRLHVNALHQHHQYAHQMLDPRAGRLQSSHQVGHHLPGLRGHVCAANEFTVLIDGILAADIHRCGVRRDDGHVAEGRAGEESFGTQ